MTAPEQMREQLARVLCDAIDPRRIAEQLDAPCFDDSGPGVQEYWRVLADVALTRPAPAELVEALPDDISELVLRIGRAEWGQTPAHDAEGHAAHVADSVRITAEHFGQDGPQHMHGLYVAGTETVICHSGTSPNSPQIARALTGAWNRLHDLAALRNAGAAS